VGLAGGGMRRTSVAVGLALGLALGLAWASAGSAADPPHRGGSATTPMTEVPLDRPATPAASKAQPIVRVPLVAPGDPIDPNGPPFVGIVQFFIGADGFVRDARFVGPPMAATRAIVTRARRWVWEPARDAHGQPVESATMLRVKATPDAVLIDRPDSTLGHVLGAANYANVKVVRADGTGAQRDINPLQLAHVFADWISEDKAYAGADPWHARCPVRFDAAISFEGPGGNLRADFARGCAWMQVTTKDRVLFVPYGPIRARIDAAFAKLFADSSAAAR